jgi:hypothetical protein
MRWVKESIRKDGNLCTEAGTSIGMETSKGKNMFVKHDVTGYVDSAFLGSKTPKTLVKCAIAQKHTLFRSEF